MDRAFGRCAGPKKVQHSAHKEKGQQNVLLQQQWQHPMQPHLKRQRERTEAQQGKKAIGGTTTAMCDAVCAKYAKKAVPHPLGLTTKLAPPPSGKLISAQSQGDFCQRTLGNALSLSWMSVQASTLDTYQNGWNQWVKWSAEFGTDPRMRVKPVGYIDPMAGPTPLMISFQVVCVLSFLAWLSIDRELKPSTCSGYLSAVRFMLNRSDIDTKFMDNNQHIKSTKTGMWIAYRCMHPEADEKTKPFTLDLLMVTWKKYLDVKHKCEDYVMLIAMMLAYVCLMRKSEYLEEDSDHYLLAESITFEVEVPVGSGQMIQVLSTDCYRHDREAMREVSINIRSAKNDEGGQGHRFTSTRVNPGTVPDRPFDIAEQLWDFACVARPVKGMAFLTWQGKWRLTYGKLNAKIKQVARGEYGDDDGFSTHSIRIAGASALANSGVPDHIIQCMGRWKSLAFLAYIRLSTGAYNAAVGLLCNLKSLTMHDVRKMMPAAK